MKTVTYDPALWQLMPKKPTDSIIERMRDQNMASSMDNWNAYISALAAAPSAPEQPISIGAGDPMAFFADFCERHGYPSDGDMDEALRGAFYEGIHYCAVHSHIAPFEPKQGWLTDEQIDDMAFGYAPSCPIGELRAFARAVLEAVKGGAK